MILVSINPIQVLLWTFRRNEQDIINLYNSLSPLMQLATENNMLNFGYWKNNPKTPYEAQIELCKLVGKEAHLNSARTVVDIGSGFSAPAMQWKSEYENININCVNINFKQLKSAATLTIDNYSNQRSLSFIQTEGISLINSTSNAMPFADNSADRVIALESAQHFRPFNRFVKEVKRILNEDGFFVLTIPVIAVPAKSMPLFLKLGILSFTWSSEHYGLNNIKSALTNESFKIDKMQSIGSDVYEPLTEHYIRNREMLRSKILKEYPSHLENILYKSLLKMKQLSSTGIIDYVLIRCSLRK